MILAGDVGGTKAVLALFEIKDGRCRRASEEVVYASRDAASLEELVERFLHGFPNTPLAAACFGVAGTLVEGKADAVNLPWCITEANLARVAHVSRIKLLNDLEAAAYGMLQLPTDEFAVLNPGIARRGNAAVIAAGTGLGEALLIWNGKHHLAISSEGGHASFSPRNEEEIELLRHLQKQFGDHVSWERVVSGPGQWNIYHFLRETGSEAEPAWLARNIETGDASAAISEAGISGRDPVCARAVELFASLYGAEASNLALKALTIGGIYIGGGIAPKILPALKQNDRFLRAFTDKGRFSKLLREIPIKVALNPRAPLLGAAAYAAERLL